MNMDPEAAMKAPHMDPRPAGHHLPKDDPANPMSWSLFQKVYTSLASWVFAASVYVDNHFSSTG